MSKKNFVDQWSTFMENHKTKVKRYFHKDDIEREFPFILDGMRQDYLSGEVLVTFHTNKRIGEEYDFSLSRVKFLELFEENEVEI